MIVNRYIKLASSFLLVVLIGSILIFGYLSFIKDYQVNRLVINKGSTSADVVDNLNNSGINTNYYLFRFWQRAKGLSLQQGTYHFTTRQSLVSLLESFDSGQNRARATELVIPEGFSNKKIYDRLAALKATSDLKEFSLEDFIDLTKDQEGYLFPDTYYLYPETTAEDLAVEISDNYAAKLLENGLSLDYEDLILASIVEREVQSYEDQRMVADILRRRMENNMRLQVDASLDYYLDKSSNELTINDLEADNPYNTYTREGLPPTPIANPGLQAIQAVLDPLPNTYTYYLSAANDGTTYYAETFDGHRENKERYL